MRVRSLAAMQDHDLQEVHLTLYHNDLEVRLTLQLQWIEPPEHWPSTQRVPWLRPVFKWDDSDKGRALQRLHELVQLRPAWPRLHELATIESAMLEALCAVPCPWSLQASALVQNADTLVHEYDVSGGDAQMAHVGQAMLTRWISLTGRRLQQLLQRAGQPAVLQACDWAPLLRELGPVQDDAGPVRVVPMHASLRLALHRYLDRSIDDDDNVPRFDAPMDPAVLTFVAMDDDDEIQGYIAAQPRHSPMGKAQGAGYDELHIAVWQGTRQAMGPLLRRLLRFAWQARGLLGLERVTLPATRLQAIHRRLLQRVDAQIYDPVGDLTQIRHAADWVVYRRTGQLWVDETPFIDAEAPDTLAALVPRLEQFEEAYPRLLNRALLEKTMALWREERHDASLFANITDLPETHDAFVDLRSEAPPTLDALLEPLGYTDLTANSDAGDTLPQNSTEMRRYMLFVLQEQARLTHRQLELEQTVAMLQDGLQTIGSMQ